jgi:hypothetical protein
MAIKTTTNLTIRTTGVAKQATTGTDRNGLGYVMAGQQPSDFLSQGQFSTPQLSNRDDVGLREGSGVSEPGYPVSLVTPTSSVGSFSGTTACRSAFSNPTKPALRTKLTATSGTQDLGLLGDMASATDLESKLNPFRPSSDYPSPLRRSVYQPDTTANQPEFHPVNWPQAISRAATAAK